MKTIIFIIADVLPVVLDTNQTCLTIKKREL